MDGASAFSVGAVFPNPANDGVVVGLEEANGFVGGVGCCASADGAKGLAAGLGFVCFVPKALPLTDPKGDAKSDTC
jgi:hypothetical protein